MKLLTMKQVCGKVGFSRAHINRFREDPQYEHVRFPRPARIGFKVLWSEEEVDSWIQAQLDKR